MKPNQVNEDNAHEVWLTLYADNTTTVPPEPKFKIGDFVRVQRYLRNADFVKGYTANFSDEDFKIIGIYRGVPTMYKIQDLGTGEKINGRFYERELSLLKNPERPEQGPENK